MKHIKKYETFDFDQTIPVTSKNFLTNFYSCDECDALWKEFNNTADSCKFCGSDEVEELQEDEWYEISKTRLDKDEIEDLESEKNKESEDLVDLFSIKKEGGKNVN